GDEILVAGHVDADPGVGIDAIGPADLVAIAGDPDPHRVAGGPDGLEQRVRSHAGRLGGLDQIAHGATEHVEVDDLNVALLGGLAYSRGAVAPARRALDVDDGQGEIERGDLAPAADDEQVL